MEQRCPRFIDYSPKNMKVLIRERKRKYYQDGETGEGREISAPGLPLKLEFKRKYFTQSYGVPRKRKKKFSREVLPLPTRKSSGAVAHGLKKFRKRILLLSPSPSKTHCTFKVKLSDDGNGPKKTCETKSKDIDRVMNARHPSFEDKTPPRMQSSWGRIESSPVFTGAKSPPQLPANLPSHVGVIISHFGSQQMRSLGRRTYIVELPCALPMYARWITVGLATWPGRGEKATGRLCLMSFKSPSSLELMLCSQEDEEKVDEHVEAEDSAIPDSVLRVRIAVLGKVRQFINKIPSTQLRLQLNTDCCIARNLETVNFSGPPTLIL
mmetsp:Transcript_14472/g.20216  ORF Transcript_14472/g.20216 Transcript_14472/m.20216 type:complete len:324 (+) Transcript_14472:118-1089(+)